LKDLQNKLVIIEIWRWVEKLCGCRW